MTQARFKLARRRHAPSAVGPRRGAARAGQHRRTRAAGAPGFTLLEIAVVIFIMGLVMTLAIPYLGGFHGAQLKSEARRLAGRATYLYDEAATENVIYRMIFDLDHNGYYVMRLDPYAPQPKFLPYSGPWGGEVVMPPGLRLRDVSVEGIGAAKAGSISCQFYPEGYVDATVIHLDSVAGEVLTLSFNPLTGNVAIVSGDVPPVTALAMTQ
ncbi:MAG TPA: prepilin-type N-terminal cleavage/methylation domain-containing protein [Candidatus Binataceae bacterium]|nr:prepilin-type N-terminal cleavage/methylation domain-containing protein [Candidatus Binataceae bacterium]